MRVAVYPADLTGCGSYRCIWVAEALQAQGYDVSLVMPGAESQISAGLLNGRMIEAELAQDADVFVFQRPTHVLLVDLIRILRRNGRTVVVEMDDDLSCIHPANPAFHQLHPARSPRNNWKLVEEACRLASFITVSTPALQAHYGTRRSRVLRNCVPSRFLQLATSHQGRRRWGWAGSVASHPDDLPLIGGAVAQMSREGHAFFVVGPGGGTGRALGLPADPPSSGSVSFERWAEALAQLSVGVAPLADTRFNLAKSFLKPLEYAAVGVPWVATNTPEYSLLQSLGAGTVVPNRTRDWATAVRRLLTDEHLWLEQSQAGLAVAAACTIEGHAWRWMETWEGAWRLDRGRLPAGVSS